MVYNPFGLWYDCTEEVITLNKHKGNIPYEYDNYVLDESKFLNEPQPLDEVLAELHRKNLERIEQIKGTQKTA